MQSALLKEKRNKSSSFARYVALFGFILIVLGCFLLAGRKEQEIAPNEIAMGHEFAAGGAIAVPSDIESMVGPASKDQKDAPADAAQFEAISFKIGDEPE